MFFFFHLFRIFCNNNQLVLLLVNLLMYIIKFLHGYIYKILHYAKEHLVLLKVLTTSTCNSFLKWPYHLVIASITYWWMCNCFPILFFLWRCSYVTRPRPIYLIFFLQSCHGFFVTYLTSLFFFTTFHSAVSSY